MAATPPLGNEFTVLNGQQVSIAWVRQALKALGVPIPPGTDRAAPTAQRTALYEIYHAHNAAQAPTHAAPDDLASPAQGPRLVVTPLGQKPTGALNSEGTFTFSPVHPALSSVAHLRAVRVFVKSTPPVDNSSDHDWRPADQLGGIAACSMHVKQKSRRPCTRRLDSRQRSHFTRPIETRNRSVPGSKKKRQTQNRHRKY